MDFRAKQIAPPKDWGRFEDLCHALFKKVWCDPFAQKNGRRGQAQHGVDVFGRPAAAATTFQGVQCKGKDLNYGAAATSDEVLTELRKADLFSPPLSHWIFATTAPVDGVLQRVARELSAKRLEQGKFPIDILGWDEIQALLASHQDVAAEFYPEHVFDVPKLLSELTSTHVKSRPIAGTAVWQPITFDNRRDLGPALMGRPLGPADAISCPRLQEADILAQQLRAAFSSRLYGQPGAGKSVCALQAALSFIQSGTRIVRLEDPQSVNVMLDRPDEVSTLFLIDDAHLMSKGQLRALEEQARPDTLVLSTHNAVEAQAVPAGAVVLDAARAVKTIAAALRKDRATTLKAVRKADNQIGERMLEVRLEQRLEEAERAAFPWQFCFILGGGWRRAKEAADRARFTGADTVLAVVAMRQLGSRDARATVTDIEDICVHEGFPAALVAEAIRSLASQRILLSTQDCRTPHQRFSAVILHHIIIGQDSEGRERIFRLIRRMLCDPTYPLAGLRVFLEEFRFGLGDYRWYHALPLPVLQSLADRCWNAAEDEPRLYAALVLVEIQLFCSDWADRFVRPNLTKFSEWMSRPGNSGYGIARLLNDTMNADKVLATEVIAACDPKSLAQAFSNVTKETAFSLSELVERIHYPTPAWSAAFRTHLDRLRLLGLAREWTASAQAFSYVRHINALVLLDEDLALEMAEAFIPAASKLLRENPLESFGDLEKLFDRILRVFDVLGVYVGKLAPTQRHRSIARAMCASIDPSIVAARVSTVRKRDLQDAAFFLDLFNTCAPRKAAVAVGKLDWNALAAVIGEDWADLPHEAEVLIGVLFHFAGTRDAVAAFVADNAHRIVNFPPRLAIVAPAVAIQHLAQGSSIRLVRFDHIDWTFGPLLVALIAEERPDLLDGFVHCHEVGLAKGLAGPNSSFFTEAAPLLNQLRVHAPDAFKAVLNKVDIEKAALGWADSLSKPGGARQAAAILVDVGLEVGGDIGALAGRLRTRFRTASVPKDDVPLVGQARRQRRRRRSS